MANDTSRVSSYLEHLPAIFQQEADEQGVTFLGRFLLAFERILSGLQPPLEDDPFPEQRGLEEIIDRIHTYFDPDATPAEFLPWLASWVALSLREDWTEEEKRRFIGRIVPLYRQRGTVAGIVEMLKTYTGMGVELAEFREPLQVSGTSTVGVDTMIGGGPPHYFRVKMTMEELDAPALARKEQIARAIIDQEKPAHTYYDLRIETQITFQIGVHSTVGVDTLLGTPKIGTNNSA